MGSSWGRSRRYCGESARAERCDVEPARRDRTAGLPPGRPDRDSVATPLRALRSVSVSPTDRGAERSAALRCDRLGRLELLRDVAEDLNHRLAGGRAVGIREHARLAAGAARAGRAPPLAKRDGVQRCFSLTFSTQSV